MDTKKIAKEAPPVVDGFDFAQLESCNDAPVDLVIDSYFGLRKNPYLCQEPNNIEIFEQGKDYELIDPQILTLTINHNDLDTNDPFQKTNPENLTGEIVLPIQVKSNSKLLEFMLNFNMNEDTSGRRGRGLLALADGGASLYRRFTYNKGKPNEYTIQTEAMNLKLKTWFDPLTGQFDSDTTVDIELSMQEWSHYQVIGTLAQDFALPTTKTPVTITHGDASFDGSEVLIPSFELTDTDLLSIDGKSYVTLYDEDLTMLDSKSVVNGDDYTFTYDGTYTKLYASIWYKYSDTLAYNTEVLELKHTVFPIKKTTKK